VFLNRVEAGRLLGHELRGFAADEPVVLALPRGGVPVGAEVARILDAPLDVIVVRKLGVPLQPEFAMGAIGEGDIRFIDWRVVSDAGVSAQELARSIERKRLEVEKGSRKYRGSGLSRLDISGRLVIIVDDGLATGSTANAAIRVARDLGASRVVMAAPVAPAETVDLMRQTADEVVVLDTPSKLYAVGQAYHDFTETTDEQVISILNDLRAAASRADLSRSA
jgi:putative phosphoribosyl transferase